VTGPRAVTAKRSEDLPAVEAAVRDFTFPLAAVRVDPKTRAVVLPFERKHPRRESWELVIRGATSVVVKGRLEQATDYFRALRHDAKGGVLAIDGVIVKVRVAVASLDVEARCLTPEETSTFDVADLPREIRKEIDARESASLKGRETYEKKDRERLVTITGAGGLAALVLGAGSEMPAVLLPFEAALGGFIAWRLAYRNALFPIVWGAFYGAPTIALSALGILLTRGTKDGLWAGFAHAAFWCLMALAGVGLAYLNAKMSADVQGLTSAAWDAADAPKKPLDRRIPGRAAAIVGGGGAVLFLLLGAPWTVWLVGALVGAGGTTWLLARFQVRSKYAGWVLGGVGVSLCFAGMGGGFFPPGTFLLAPMHFVAGLMTAYYSRGEGPR
jgi:hypothetical protein